MVEASPVRVKPLRPATLKEMLKVDSPDRRIRHTMTQHAVAFGANSPPAVLLALTIASALSGCGVAPLIQDAGEHGPSVLAQMDSARPAAAATADGITLRGAVVEKPNAECVVLHLLPSATSVTTGVPAGFTRVGLAPTLAVFREHGFSSLVLDYRGLGDSDGQRDSDMLLIDGLAMWHEAVRLAGGLEERVIIRAGSLGSIVVADLLDHGARPRAIVLYAPVSDGTVVKHAAQTHYDTLAAFWIRTFYTSPGTIDLYSAIRRAEMPVLLLLPEADAYLPTEEQAELRAAALAHGHAVVVHPGDHQTLVLRAWGFSVVPGDFSGRRSPELLDAELDFLRVACDRTSSLSHGSARDTEPE